MTPNDYSTGVTNNEPMKNGDHTYRETLCMGYASMTQEDIQCIIVEMSYDWRGCTYDILTRNCHHFSDAFCRQLGVGRLPPWLNELADTGANAVDFLDSAD